jgi:hypothetical protein
LHAFVLDNDDCVREYRPVPSANFPNLMALVAASAVEDVARTKKTSSTLALGMGNSWRFKSYYDVSSGSRTVKNERAS